MVEINIPTNHMAVHAYYHIFHMEHVISCSLRMLSKNISLVSKNIMGTACIGMLDQFTIFSLVHKMYIIIVHQSI